MGGTEEVRVMPFENDQLAIPDFEDGRRGPLAKEHRQSLAVGKGSKFSLQSLQKDSPATP